MPSAVIGNLRVSLGLDSAEFTSGAKKAQSTLAGLSSSIKGFAAGIVGGLSLAGVTAVLKSSIDHMDELGKASQKIGIPVEELSKLEYAARLADVPLQDLTGSVGKFSKAISEVAAGGSNDAGKALTAIGVSALDASGKLRPTSDILAEVADKFAGFRDGANKTAIAMAIFGKSGADMIPLLNGGRDAIAGAGAELERFGGVVTAQASANAEAFNDNLTRLEVAGQSLTNQVAAGMTPALVNVTNAMVDFAAEGTVVEQITKAMNFVMQEMAIFVSNASATWGELASYVTFAGKAFDALTNGDLSGIGAEWEAMNQRVSDAWAKNAETVAKIRGEVQRTTSELKTDLGGQTKPKYTTPALPDAPAFASGTDSSAAKIKKQFDELAAAGKRVWEDTRTPIEKYQNSLKELNTLLQAGKIDQDTYGRAVKQLQDQFSESADSMQSDLMSLKDMMDQVGSDLASGFSNAIGSMIDGTQSFKGAIKSMVGDVVRNLSDMFLNKAFSSLFSFGGSSGLGSLFGGFSGLYANGGTIPAGKWGIAGEAGPEIISGPASVTPMGRSAGGAVTINVSLSGANGDAAVAKLAREAVTQGLREYDRQQPRRDLERSLRVR